GLGQEAFGTYSISRRLAGTLVALTTLGMSTAMPRYIAVARDAGTTTAFLVAGFLLGVLPSVVLLGLGATAPATLAALVFHDASQGAALIATLLGLVGYSGYVVLYGYYRGIGRVGAANGWQLFVAAVGPVAVAWSLASRASVAVVLFWLAVAYL